MRNRCTVWKFSIFTIIVLSIAGRAKATPIKLSPMAVTASASYSGMGPTKATDGQVSTFWNAGSSGTQWIQLDLGRTISVRKIRLMTAQSPAGYTNHVITAGQDPTSLHAVTSFAGNTSDSQWLEYANGATNLGNVRYIRITTTQSPSWIAWREIELYGGIEYFGYFADAYDVVGNGNYIDETTGTANTNLVWIASSYVPQTNFAARLQQAHDDGAKAILILGPQLFLESALRDDWETQWADIAATVRAAPANSVAAFYPADEPYGHGFDIGTLTTVTTRIRQDFPDIPIAVILDASYGWRSFVTPAHVAMFDWVGFDCYWGDWDHCGDPYPGVPMLTLISNLRSLLTPNQRMITVPWAWHNDSTAPTREEQNVMVKIASQWQAAVLSDATYVAVTPFLWQSWPEGRLFFGTRDMPQVKDQMYRFAYSSLSPSTTPRYPIDYSASGTAGDNFPYFAFNRDLTDMWNSGGYAPAWIEADFGGSTRIGRIELIVAQNPAGPTTHLIQGLNQSGTWVTLGTLQKTTSNGMLLVWTGTADVSRVRITTTQSPSWVAWHEIRFSRI
jgi:hypothetical protein